RDASLFSLAFRRHMLANRWADCGRYWRAGAHTVHIRNGRPKEACEMLIKITEAVRARALRRPLVPAVYHDTDIKRFALIVRTGRAFWAQEYQLRGLNPRTGKRYGGGTRCEIGDAIDMPLAYARAAALRVKAAVREGRDPHGERMTKRQELARE